MVTLEPRRFLVNELSTGQYTASLVDNDGVTPLPGGTLTALRLTLYVIKADGTQAIVNSRTNQNVLNLNNVTISAGGALVWLVQVLDTTLVEDIPFESHIALWHWTWPGGEGRQETILVVKNLARTT